LSESDRHRFWTLKTSALVKLTKQEEETAMNEQRHLSRLQNEETEATLPPPRWPTSPFLPSGAQIKLVFRDLISFWYNTRNECEIGIHGSSPRHHAKMVIFEAQGCKELFSYAFEKPTAFHDVVLKAFRQNGAEVRSVYCYEQNAAFTRDEGDDPNDFRWLLDIEGPDFYGDYTDKRSGGLLSTSPQNTQWDLLCASAN